jgi:adenosine deaminase
LYQKGDIPLFAPIFTKAKTAGLKLTLHFAETAATSSDTELLTLLSFNPERLGHVIHVSSTIKDEIIKRKLGLELCVSCNVKAKMMVKTSGSFADHHFREWWEGGSGCPVILCVRMMSEPTWKNSGRGLMCHSCIDG